MKNPKNSVNNDDNNNSNPKKGFHHFTSKPLDEHEIQELIDSKEFTDFVKSIEDSLDNGATFNEVLSSQTILQKALKLIKQSTQKQEQ